jgi:hypothetical protein
MLRRPTAVADPFTESSRALPRAPPPPSGQWRPRAVDILRRRGEIAQLVEHTTENRGVPGSSPGLAIARVASVPTPGTSSGRFESGSRHRRISRGFADPASPRGRPVQTEWRTGFRQAPQIVRCLSLSRELNARRPRSRATQAAACHRRSSRWARSGGYAKVLRSSILAENFGISVISSSDGRLRSRAERRRGRARRGFWRNSVQNTSVSASPMSRPMISLRPVS